MIQFKWWIVVDSADGHPIQNVALLKAGGPLFATAIEAGKALVAHVNGDAEVRELEVVKKRSKPVSSTDPPPRHPPRESSSGAPWSHRPTMGQVADIGCDTESVHED